MKLTRRSSATFGWALGAMALSTACGSRAPLDFELYDQDSGALLTADGSPVGSADGGPDGGPVKIDGGPGIADTGIPAVNCGVCIANSCGQNVVTCVANTACRDVLQCALLNCLQGGLDPTCLFKCASGNPGGALQASAVLQCVGSNCGQTCISAFGSGGPGGINGGGGGGGAPPRDGGSSGSGGGRWGGGQIDRDLTCDMLATWPELTCSAAQRVAEPVAE